MSTERTTTEKIEEKIEVKTLPLSLASPSVSPARGIYSRRGLLGYLPPCEYSYSFQVFFLLEVPSGEGPVDWA